MVTLITLCRLLRFILSGCCWRLRRLTVVVTAADDDGHGGWRWWRWLLLMVCELAAYLVLLLSCFCFFSFGSSWLRCHGSPTQLVLVFLVHTHTIVVCHCLIKYTLFENMDLYQPSLHWCLNNCNRSYKCFVICLSYLSWVTANVTNPEPQRKILIALQLPIDQSMQA